jgi:hypothetical protein
MRTIARIAFAVVLFALAVPAHADVSVPENKKTLEVDCAKDPTISLLGNNITVTTKGVCERLLISGNFANVTGSVKAVYVTGNSNKVTLAAADEIMVSGNDNSVSVRAAVTRKAPKIANSGNGNKVSSK